MAYNIQIAGYNMTEYLSARPLVRVQLSSLAGSMIIPETTLELIHVDGMFTGEVAPFKNCVDEPCSISYNGVEIFSGVVTSFRDNPTGTSIVCQSSLARKLRTVISWEQTNTTPAMAAKNILMSIGIEVDSSFDEAHATYLNDNALINCFVSLADNSNVATIVGALADLATADVYVLNNVVYWSRYTTPYAGYTITDILSVPAISNDGMSKQFGQYSIRYLFDGQVPMVGGEGSPTWNVDYSNTQQIQITTSAAATYYGEIRLNARSLIRPVYSFQTKTSSLPLFIGEWFTLNDGILDGRYRMMSYSTDGKNYTVEVQN